MRQLQFIFMSIFVTTSILGCSPEKRGGRKDFNHDVNIDKIMKGLTPAVICMKDEDTQLEGQASLNLKQIPVNLKSETRTVLITNCEGEEQHSFKQDNRFLFSKILLPSVQNLSEPVDKVIVTNHRTCHSIEIEAEDHSGPHSSFGVKADGDSNPVNSLSDANTSGSVDLAINTVMGKLNRSLNTRKGSNIVTIDYLKECDSKDTEQCKPEDLVIHSVQFSIQLKVEKVDSGDVLTFQGCSEEADNYLAPQML